MKTQNILIVCLAAATAGAAFLLIHSPDANRPVQSTTISSRPAKTALSEPARAAASELASDPIPASLESPTPEKATTVKAPEKSAAKAQSGPQSQGGGNSKPRVEDEWARLALIFVGVDPQAEAYWIAAINDPDLSNHERQDLIEDLNEEGLSDPENPTAEDLPLIVNRLRLIENLGPYSMDNVNADAFDEARKDLVNMFQKITGTAWR